MLAPPLRLVVILTVTGMASNTEVPAVMTSWWQSSITLRIPRNFPPNTALLTLAVLYPSSVPSRSGGGGVLEMPRLGPASSTLAHLRMPSHPDATAWARPTLGNGLPVMVLLSNPKEVFHTRLQDHSGTFSLRLKRPLNLTDYVGHGDSYKLRAVIGPNGTPLTPKRRNGRVQPQEGVIDVTVIITDDIKCSNPPKSVCFLPEEELVLRQWENRVRMTLLALPSPSVVCPDLTATYSITMTDTENGREELLTDTNRLKLVPAGPFDREKRDVFRFSITCSVQNGKHRLATHTVKGNLTILDEDDSAPFLSRNPFFEWHYSLKRNSELHVLDPDLTATNKYLVNLLGNTHNLVEIESVGKFSIRKELCMTEAENITGYTFNSSCTLLTPVVMFDEACLRANLPPKIHFAVEFIDKTLHPDAPGANRKVIYNVTLTLPVYDDSTSAEDAGRPRPDQLAQLKDHEESRATFLTLMKETPPPEVNLTVTLPVNIYYRLGQLIFPDMSNIQLPTYIPSNVTFTLRQESMGVGVGVTPTTGILYVVDPDLLKEGHVIVQRGDATTSVFIMIEESSSGSSTSSSSSSSCGSKGVAKPVSCASLPFKGKCQASCGLGAPGTCSWRPYMAVNGTIPSRHYGTCSPALNTCPNGVCDELELQYHGICPQDCIDESMRRSKHLMISSSGRGIEAGLGVCTCDVGCQCFPAPAEEPTPSTPKKESTHAQCGTVCQVGVSCATLVFVLLTLLCLLICRRRIGRSGKQKGGVISLGTLPTEERSSSLPYNPRDETHDSLIYGIRSSPRPDHNLVPALNLTVDRNWEFPRSRLVIEQTLGEGEFGKVMKARAQGIVGNLGYTAVAVKMLKSNSTQTELQDLLSEYSLLKEVSHPNVIKLLGACTSKGGPIYIIIEYCQYGSLRNFLKRSRHAEFENRVGSGPADGTAADYAITPKDLLSFAWQICKGMAYLTNMKLVHRDLAARNVLLAEGKVCKISDFGLTRDVYEADLYLKRSKGRVPVKWMALESLVDHMYTSKSDVWSFGVLLWELVTLGTPPYPGVSPERLFSLLRAGYRMEKPENCSQELYDVMLQCWAEDPKKRPCFQELTDIFENMIQADVEYLELRSLIVTNRGYFDAVPEPPQEFLDAPPQFQDEVQQSQGAPQQVEEEQQPPPPILQAPPQLHLEEAHTQPPQQDWSPPPEEQLDSDLYLVARSDMSRPRREESTEPLLAPTSPLAASLTAHHANQHHHTPAITTSHAHNPAYSPTGDISSNPPLHYSTLAARPDEEDAHTLECCRSEEDSDSGRATGDSGYATEEGRGRWRGEHKGVNRAPQTSPRGSSYSPVPRHDHGDDQEDDQDTSEDLEERQELLTEDLLGHLTPSPEPAQTAHTARTAHATHAAHTTPVIV
ncbi:proto-oncogene tyrosine-protein kinase receptor Ret isoform X2 [Panulirus ornatus]|uniref:proto-oncogene tyrosine-protein kinase receptor Ret isoform X2 n=1 Tax=Panulirus ornatus TaxID=150431 RepID=UPI003A8BC37A